MYNFLHNSKSLVIPGRESANWGTFDITPEYYETPYGLVLPSSELSLAMIRFLRNYDRLNTESYEWVTAEDRRFFAHLLNNVGQLELVSIDCALVNGMAHYSLEVFSLPVSTEKWQVAHVADYVKASVMSEIVSNMSMQDAVNWLDSQSGHRFQKPIPIDIANWVEYRKEKKLSGKFLQNHSFNRKKAHANKDKT